MAKVEVEEGVEASAQSVWELVREFGGVARWAGPAIQSCSLEGEGVGAVRTLGLPGGATLQERLEAFDEGGRSLSYSILEPTPIPVANYLSTLHVVEDGPERCRIEWSGSFDPAGASEDQVTGMIRGIYTGGIVGIRNALGL